MLQAHTFLEIIQCRWGTKAHLMFMFVAFMTNFIVTVMMVMGAVVATHVLTGVNSYGEALLAYLFSVTRVDTTCWGLQYTGRSD